MAATQTREAPDSVEPEPIQAGDGDVVPESDDSMVDLAELKQTRACGQPANDNDSPAPVMEADRDVAETDAKKLEAQGVDDDADMETRAAGDAPAPKKRGRKPKSQTPAPVSDMDWPAEDGVCTAIGGCSYPFRDEWNEITAPPIVL
jgi:hypothetical protein